MKKAFAVLLIATLSSVTIAHSQNSEIPEWLQEEWNSQTQGSGTWIADNSEFKSEKEPYDAYGLEWQYGLGKKSVTGRLFVVREDKDLGTIWEFRIFWDPKNKEAVIQQFGSDGTFGRGQITSSADGKYRTEEVFTSPSGMVYSSGHKKEYINESTSRVSSFSIDKEGRWTKNRTYLWKRVGDINLLPNTD